MAAGPVLDPERTCSDLLSFDHLICAAGQRERKGETGRPVSFEVDDQVEFGGLLDRQFSWLPLEFRPT